MLHKKSDWLIALIPDKLKIRCTSCLILRGKAGLVVDRMALVVRVGAHLTFFFLYRIVLAATLLVLQALVDLLKNLMLNLAGKSEFLGSLGDGPRWEIEVDLVDDLAQNAFHVGENDGLC